MHYLYRYVCILNVFFYMCIWTIVCNKEFIIIIKMLYHQPHNLENSGTEDICPHILV